MDKFALNQFLTLLKREVLEHRNLFVLAPAFLALLLLFAAFWISKQFPRDQLASGVAYLAMLFDGLSPVDMAPVFMIGAIPFVFLLYTCAFVYLMNSLYQDRRDLSVLFWQSMPVSNLKTVLSKVVTIAAVAPFFYIAVLFEVYLIAMIWLTLLGIQFDIEIVGIGYMFLAAVVSLVFVYLSAIVTALWLFPSVGWLLLFSAFAKRTPFMWAAGVFILVGFLEDFLFGSQYLANWVESRANPNQYVIFSFGDLVDRLFNYDMLFGIFVGAILIAGAVLMRCFTD
jgi:ABC-2 type transport system permease protein